MRGLRYGRAVRAERIVSPVSVETMHDGGGTGIKKHFRPLIRYRGLLCDVVDRFIGFCGCRRCRWMESII